MSTRNQTRGFSDAVDHAPAADPGSAAVLAQASAPPNVIVVITDDMRDSDWQALPRTRELVGNIGTTFPNFLLTTPVCSPSRVSLLTGMYAHHHGVWLNDGRRGGMRQFKKQNLGRSTIAAALQGAGYRTGLFGKFLNGTKTKGKIPGGWDRWLVDTSRNYYKPELNQNGKPKIHKKSSKYSTDILAAAARDFIRKTPANQPFLLWFTPRAPHGKHQVRRKDRGTFKGARIVPSPDVGEADVSDKPADIRRRKVPSLRKLAKLERKRLEMLIATDDAVASILATVEAEGRLENTVIFVLSDNGYMMGSHRCVKKGFAYLQSTQVTMMASGGPFASGGVDHRVAANIDIAPTIANLAGVTLPDADGVPLSDRALESEILVEAQRGKRSYSGLRSADLLYVEMASNERELYDYTRDPYEIDNLLATWNGHVPAPEDQERAAGMRERLNALRNCAGPTCH